jgi:hypothetical protein
MRILRATNRSVEANSSLPWIAAGTICLPNLDGQEEMSTCEMMDAALAQEQ